MAPSVKINKAFVLWKVKFLGRDCIFTRSMGKNRAGPLLGRWGRERLPRRSQAGEEKDRPPQRCRFSAVLWGQGKLGLAPSSTRLGNRLLAGRLVSDQPGAPVPSGLVL